MSKKGCPALFRAPSGRFCAPFVCALGSRPVRPPLATALTYLKIFMMEKDLALIEPAYFRFRCMFLFFTQLQPAVLIPKLYN
jgi:hypothetical protein